MSLCISKLTTQNKLIFFCWQSSRNRGVGTTQLFLFCFFPIQNEDPDGCLIQQLVWLRICGKLFLFMLFNHFLLAAAYKKKHKKAPTNKKNKNDNKERQKLPQS